MDNRIVNIHSAYNLDNAVRTSLRLHDHGLLRLISLDINSNLLTIKSNYLLESLVSDQNYQCVFFDHYTQKIKGKHGPFDVNNISVDDFSVIDKETFKNDLMDIISSPKWSCPPVSEQKIKTTSKLLDSLTSSEIKIFIFDKCFEFNNMNNTKKYEHEWSHALSSFFEFIILDITKKKVHILILTYE